METTCDSYWENKLRVYRVYNISTCSLRDMHGDKNFYFVRSCQIFSQMFFIFSNAVNAIFPWQIKNKSSKFEYISRVYMWQRKFYRHIFIHTTAVIFNFLLSSLFEISSARNIYFCLFSHRHYILFCLLRQHYSLSEHKLYSIENNQTYFTNINNIGLEHNAVIQ